MAAIAFGVGAVVNVASGDRREAIAGFALSTFLFVTFFYQRREERIARDFASWLTANAIAIRERGGAQYGDYWITPDTRTRELTLCVSMLILAFRLPSRSMVEGRDPVGVRAAMYTIVTVLLGWWSIHGFFWTPVALFHNIRGGRRSTVREQLAALGAWS